MQDYANDSVYIWRRHIKRTPRSFLKSMSKTPVRSNADQSKVAFSSTERDSFESQSESSEGNVSSYSGASSSNRYTAPNVMPAMKFKNKTKLKAKSKSLPDAAATSAPPFLGKNQGMPAEPQRYRTIYHSKKDKK